MSTSTRVAIVGTAQSAASWLRDVLHTPLADALLILDERRNARPRSDIVDLLADTGLALPRGSQASDRWVRLTDFPGATLAYVDVPEAVANAAERVIASEPRGQAGAARAWVEIVHPNTALRASALPRAGVVELAAWLPATWVLGLDSGPNLAVAVTRHPVMAELLAYGNARMVERAAGIEALTPWEEPAVQRLFELHLQPRDAGTALQYVDESPLGERWLARLAETIGATLEPWQRGGPE